MSIREYESGIYIAGQIYVADFPSLIQVGIRTIICNRPDGEDKTQPDYDEIQKIAAQHGIVTYHLPVTSAILNKNHGIKMSSLLYRVERPLLAYCRSGERSRKLYVLAQKIREK